MTKIPEKKKEKELMRKTRGTSNRAIVEAGQDIDRIREATKTPGWSGAHEIRKWRDAGRKS